MPVWSPQDEKTGRAVTVTAGQRVALLDDLAVRLATGRGFSVATLNLDHVVKLRASPAFRAAYLAHSHVTADGNPIVWLSRLAGQPVDLVPGADLVGPVAALAARAGVGVALVGSTDGSLAGAAASLERDHPGLRVVLCHAPPMGFDPSGPSAEPVIAAIRASGAQLCYLALGAPKQEIFAARAQADLPNVGFLSIGAGLDFLAGHQRRAPRVVRALAAEWLWRMAGNPRRLARRYLACAAILPGLTLSALRERGARHPAS
jgi:exopolysaccharide biosynthesis WecB/TagA/CpsF family protein